MRNLRLLGASLTAMLAVAALPAAGRAETGPHWFSEGKLLPGETIPVRSGGVIGLGLASERFPQEGYYCGLKGSGTISNPPGGGPGTDETLALRFSGCTINRDPGVCGESNLRAIPLGLPWRSHLAFASPGHVDDVFEGVALEVRCGKRPSLGVFSGTLHSVLEMGRFSFTGELSDGSEHLSFSASVLLRGPRGHRRITAA